jgi:hypothetical protein
MQDSRSTFGSLLTQVQHPLKELANLATSFKNSSDQKNSKRKRPRGKYK